MLNDMFDALNRRFPSEGIRINGSDFKVLEKSLNWLDEWESNFDSKNITHNEFLTRNTSEGLRVTIKSTLELSKFLLNDCGFKYVLTNKMNQDRLEQFFGTIRQATGPNEHPTTPTFLQVYKLISIYSILKPPKTGNCQILDSNSPQVTYSDLKEIFSVQPSERQKKIERLKNKLDSLVQEGNWDPLDDVLLNGHDYCAEIKSTTKDCVIYYICGYLCRIVHKYTKCNKCLLALKGTGTQPQASLTNLKSKGFLVHPNFQLFQLISVIEEGLNTFVTTSNVFNNIVDYVIDNYSHLLTFPCFEHKSEMLTMIFQNYIVMRMKQYTLIHNRELKKNCSSKKKLSKLQST